MAWGAGYCALNVAVLYLYWLIDFIPRKSVGLFPIFIDKLALSSQSANTHILRIATLIEISYLYGLTDFIARKVQVQTSFKAIMVRLA